MKRGTMQVELITVFILVIAFLLIMGMYFIRARDSFGAIEDDAPCAAEIKTHTIFSAATGEFMSTEITCPTNLVDVRSTDKEYANNIIAEEMTRCWGIWGRGNLSLFGDEVSDPEAKGSSGVFCHVCSLISMPEIDEIEGLPKYLAENDYKPGMKYVDFLTGQKQGKFFEDEDFQVHANDAITTENSLGVVFYYYKGKYWTDAVMTDTLGNPIVAMLGGAVLIGWVAAAVGSGGMTVAATAAGGAAGGIGSFFIRPGSDTLAVVYVRPLTEAGVESLNCAYAPVKEG